MYGPCMYIDARDDEIMMARPTEELSVDRRPPALVNTVIGL